MKTRQIQKISKFVTTDEQEFVSENEAVAHQIDLDLALAFYEADLFDYEEEGLDMVRFLRRNASEIWSKLHATASDVRGTPEGANPPL